MGHLISEIPTLLGISVAPFAIICIVYQTILISWYDYWSSQTYIYSYNGYIVWCYFNPTCRFRKIVVFLVWTLGIQRQNFHHLWLKAQGVVIVVEDEFKSQPFQSLYYTYNETLEGLRCCKLPEEVQRYSIWVRKVVMR